MTAALAPPALPWSGDPAEVRRFNRFLIVTLFPALLVGAIMPHLPVSQQADETPPPETPRLVKLSFEPPPPPPEPEPAPTPARQVAPQPAPKPAAAATSAAKNEQAKAPVKKQVDRTAEIRKNLQRLRDNPQVLSAVSDRPLKKSVTSDQPRQERLSAALDQGADEIGVATPRREKGELELSGHASTRVSAPAAGKTGTGQQDGRPGGGGGSGRSSQEIQTVFDRHKSVINAIYERALRNNPDMAGKLVLRLTIEPSGEVSACKVVSNALGDRNMAAQIVRRVERFDFGAKQVPAVTLDYPIEFFPG